MEANPMGNSPNENIAIILQQVLRETRALREENQQLCEEIRVGQASECASGETVCETPRRRRRRRTASKDCQAAVRAVYKTLIQTRNVEGGFAGFNFQESYLSPANRQISHQICEETIQDNGGENCEYQRTEIKVAVKRYYDSKKEDHKRQRDGTLANHRAECRKHQRLAAKQHIRADALETIDWPEEKKQKWTTVVNELEYHSSEESAEEGDERERRIVFNVRKLLWEKKELKDGKRELDEHQISKLSRRAQLKRVLRRRGVKDSDRARPERRLRWAVKKPPTNYTADGSVNVGQPLHASTPQ